MAAAISPSRPSGTEPKLKLYLSAKAGTQAEAEALLNRLPRRL